MATKRKAAKKKKSSAKKSSRKTARKKSTARKSSAKRTTKRAAKKSRTKRAPNPAFMKPMQPDSQLAAVVGGNPMPRTEVTKKLWGYIKRNGLQDSKERRMINADEKLKPVFNGKSKVSMFEMTKLVNKHLKNT